MRSLFSSFEARVAFLLVKALKFSRKNISFDSSSWNCDYNFKIIKKNLLYKKYVFFDILNKAISIENFA